MTTDKKAESTPPLARLLIGLVAVGSAALIIGYALGFENSTPQYSAILGGSLLFFLAAMTILIWQFALQLKNAEQSFPRLHAWIIGGLMAVSGALLVWGTFVDQLKN